MGKNKVSLRIIPGPLTGTVQVPSSKSMGHRALICAALAEGKSRIDGVSSSEDIEATRTCLEQLGAKIAASQGKNGRTCFQVHGMKHGLTGKLLDCRESGSTLRFMIPLAALSGEKIIFTGSGKLGIRPLSPYANIFRKQRLVFREGSQTNHFPLTVQGPLRPGQFILPGDVSSQFISGLLFALPLLHGDSTLDIVGKLESWSYIALTLAALQQYGITIHHTNYRHYDIPGNQQYISQDTHVEGDYSQAAFWLVAGMLGENISLAGMNAQSCQGDRAIIPILQKMGGQVDFVAKNLVSQPASSTGTTIDAADCPDLIPVLTVAAALSQGHTEIIHAGRLRLKECDRLAAMATELTKLGAHITENPDGLSIDGVASFSGGTVECWNDHRVAMSLAIASIRCRQPIILKGTDCVAKSYPDFWKDFEQLGGRYEQYDR